MSISSSHDNGQVFSKLGHQEKQVLLLLSQDKSDREIAKSLFLSEGTIRNCVNSILSELRLHKRVETTAYALKHNLKGHMGNSD